MLYKSLTKTFGLAIEKSILFCVIFIGNVRFYLKYPNNYLFSLRENLKTGLLLDSRLFYKRFYYLESSESLKKTDDVEI